MIMVLLLWLLVAFIVVGFGQLRAVTQHVIRQQLANKRVAIQHGSHQVATSIVKVACLLEETVLETTLQFSRGIDETGSWLIQQQESPQGLQLGAERTKHKTRPR
jgi:hypothetical protein